MSGVIQGSEEALTSGQQYLDRATYLTCARLGCSDNHSLDIFHRVYDIYERYKTRRTQLRHRDIAQRCVALDVVFWKTASIRVPDFQNTYHITSFQHSATKAIEDYRLSVSPSWMCYLLVLAKRMLQVCRWSSRQPACRYCWLVQVVVTSHHKAWAHYWNSHEDALQDLQRTYSSGRHGSNNFRWECVHIQHLTIVLIPSRGTNIDSPWNRPVLIHPSLLTGERDVFLAFSEGTRVLQALDKLQIERWNCGMRSDRVGSYHTFLADCYRPDTEGAEFRWWNTAILFQQSLWCWATNSHIQVEVRPAWQALPHSWTNMIVKRVNPIWFRAV